MLGVNSDIARLKEMTKKTFDEIVKKVCIL